MAKAYSSIRAKGRRGETAFAKLLREKGIDKNARRMPMSGALSHFKTDIYTTVPWAVEVKTQERVSLWQWWDQTVEQATPPKNPLLVVGANHRPQLCVLRVEDWADLVRDNMLMEEELKELREPKP